ncbi:Phosphorylase superfamily protein [Colletotrichum higginsianum IMI 349063]|uniref:Phosphorylase superfamily protein n=1 Tax=Colletotrichum higginsianum (strain IMI 349063) TaxID=759273 RepID=A0A1B7XQV5_COLHI|nr:Phosphorylase superfamily protein [Colletotrichum higginsianum IMI 349063]OBR02137.1 Phosphorylase superfamily protein [Colletotrichum higginsianum IMI 349063]
MSSQNFTNSGSVVQHNNTGNGLQYCTVHGSTTFAIQDLEYPCRTTADHPVAKISIAIICALPLAYDAVSLLFDFWEDEWQYSRAYGDTNMYVMGRIGEYNVALALLPDMGTAATARAAAGVRLSFTRLKISFLVGACGGVPGTGPNEVLLGDVIIKLGKKHLQKKTGVYLKQLQNEAVRQSRRSNYQYPSVAEDKLFAPTYRHRHCAPHPCSICSEESDGFCEEAIGASCAELRCDDNQLVPRGRQETNQNQAPDDMRCPKIHIGRIASGVTAMKSGEHRDRVAAQLDVIAFETEGASAWDEVPCIVIKGVCDYADSHKNKKWQPYAAATAASVMRAVLEWYASSTGSTSTSVSINAYQ